MLGARGDGELAVAEEAEHLVEGVGGEFEEVGRGGGVMWLCRGQGDAA